MILLERYSRANNVNRKSTQSALTRINTPHMLHDPCPVISLASEHLWPTGLARATPHNFIFWPETQSRVYAAGILNRLHFFKAR